MNIKGIVKGSILSYAAAFVVLLAAAALVYFNVLEERTASIAVFIGVILAVFIGSLGAAKGAENKLFFNALLVGLGFTLIVFIAAAIVNGSFVLSARCLALMGSMIAASVVAAMFAG